MITKKSLQFISNRALLDQVSERENTSEFLCASSLIVQLWNFVASEGENPINFLSTIFVKPKHHIECVILDILNTALEGEEFCHSEHTKKLYNFKGLINITQEFVQLCASNMIGLPCQTDDNGIWIMYDLGLAEKFWNDINSKIDMNRFKVKGTSKISKIWRTEDSDTFGKYDFNKVLESFEELETKDTNKKRKKSKKKKKVDKEKVTSTKSNKPSEENHTFISDSEQSTRTSETALQGCQEYFSVEPPQPENNQSIQASEKEIESVQEYIDSIEQENRCLKVSQQFYNCLEKDNEEMKKDLEKLKESKLCKICMDKEACIVFIPCGHLMSCINCSPEMKNCAICRKPVKSTVRTYFS